MLTTVLREAHQAVMLLEKRSSCIKKKPFAIKPIRMNQVECERDSSLDKEMLEFQYVCEVGNVCCDKFS